MKRFMLLKFLLGLLGLIFVVGLGLDAFWLEPSSIRLARHDVTWG